MRKEYYSFELVVQFPARGSTQVLLCLFPDVLWLWHFLYSVGPHPVSSLHIYTFVVSRAFMAFAASRAGGDDSSRAPGLTSGLQGRGPWMSTMVLYCWCHSDSASVLLYFTFQGKEMKVNVASIVSAVLIACFLHHGADAGVMGPPTGSIFKTWMIIFVMLWEHETSEMRCVTKRKCEYHSEALLRTSWHISSLTFDVPTTWQK